MAFLEACAADMASVAAAVRGGAYRIELCTGLSADGFTPSAGFIRSARQLTQGRCRMNVLIRPDEAKGFVLDSLTAGVALQDIVSACEAGADGIVAGALTHYRTLDTAFISQAINITHSLGKTFTFHRAFDIAADPFKVLEQLIDLGCDCILTSGQEPSAEKGIPMLKELVARAAGRIEIMPGAGVRPENATDIVRQTGCRYIHSSSRRPGATSSDHETVNTIVNSIKAL